MTAAAAAKNKTSVNKVHVFRQAVEANPDSAVAHMKLGTALLLNGAAGPGEVALRRAVELDPEFDEAWVNLGGILLARWDFKGCLEINEKVVERNPGLLQAHYNIGLCHLYLHQAEEMVASFRKVMEIDPNHADGQYHIAVGLLELGDPAGARAALDRSASLGHSPAPEFLKALEKKEAGTTPGPKDETSR